MAQEPNQGATGGFSAEEVTNPEGDGTTRHADPAGADATINQGAPGSAPDTDRGESPLSVDAEHDAFAERPELFVGAAFAGGLLLAQVLKRLGR